MKIFIYTSNNNKQKHPTNDTSKHPLVVSIVLHGSDGYTERERVCHLKSFEWRVFSFFFMIPFARYSSCILLPKDENVHSTQLVMPHIHDLCV